jgi:hypothetical protein
MINFYVYDMVGKESPVMEKVGVVTAENALAALRIAKQKGHHAPIIGEAHVSTKDTTGSDRPRAREIKAGSPRGDSPLRVLSGRRGAATQAN